jgi:endonuclease YncB( thermonuclease family)
VIRVIDGDTFVIGAEKIRIANIDAPEIHGRCVAEDMLAAVATGALAALVEHCPLTLTRQGRDRYGRTLALVSACGHDVGATLIAEKVAVAWKGHRGNWC